ncbi:MAG: Chromate resistance protein ChrB [Acidimicrobiales bacterium]
MPTVPDTTGPISWLVLVYRVPSEPTRLRAAVWRRLKALGAVYLQSSVAALPASPGAERALRTLRNEIIEHMGGHGLLLSGVALAGEPDMVGATNEARNDEYEEIVDRCRDFLAGIDKEIAESHFTYGELEENDEDLAKLRGWFDKVLARDALGAAGAKEAEAALGDCARALDGFAARVYEADAVSS